ncbi:I78 family peptidase inhibitor [Pseudomonas massiliensis]|uniref:I78 family peptidase inhibitor n=1 Tax=Pseudomonas massiliensis TaxID=522492 RepID=UPI00058E9B02|nr:I78 family peptidase inhibitor [Pseudomonas massiliensis]
MTNEEITQRYSYLIGTPYDESMKATISTETGRDRVLGPNEISTMEFDPQRVHIRVDGNGNVQGLAFN